MTLLREGRTLDYGTLQEGQQPIPVDNEKSVHLAGAQAKARQAQRPQRKPAPDHPWRGYSSTTPLRIHIMTTPQGGISALLNRGHCELG